MNLSKIYWQRMAIGLGMGAAIGVGFLASWYFTPKNSCVRTISNSGKASSGQEVVYSWGCIQPQRFRQWSVIAAVDPEPELVPHLKDFSRNREL
ncbi:MAG: hypothetical protein NW224_25360 [Leptolyngbyaceae cyanobacterium bins.302]|nr:hypothetical protein [Leptolyngbyaceae cyanobacterium bins.302]